MASISSFVPTAITPATPASVSQWGAAATSSTWVMRDVHPRTYWANGAPRAS